MRTRHIPERTCLACGEKLPKGGLIRIVRTLAGSVEMDPNGRQAGRGAYLCPKSDCWERGLSKGALDRVLRISVPEETKERLKAQYKEQREFATGNGAP